MIKTLRIQNYQSHKDTALELVPGINVIGGHSDCGKSGILRALYWLIFNRPLGDGFRSNWGGDTEVSVLLTDGPLVRRVKSNKENYYAVDDEELRAGGSEVPSLVRETLLLDEVNVQRQMDAPFLLSSSPAEVARVFNTAVHLDSIDLAFSNANSSVRDLASCATDAETSIKEDEEVLAGFGDMGAIEEVLQCAEEMVHAMEAATTEHQHLEEVLMALQDASQEHNRLESKCARASGRLDTAQHAVDAVKEAGLLLAGVEKQEQDLQLALQVLQQAQSNHEQLLAKVVAIDKEWLETMPAVCPLCDSTIKESH